MTVTLAVTAVVAVGAGVAGGASHHQELATGTGRGGATTPVLSARRAPSLVAAGTARRRLRAELAPLQAKAGPGHCLSASSAGVSLATDSADVALMPGSNLKLATAFALLREIPPDTRFSTRLAAGVPPKGGKLDGDLWFIGEGDPLLATADYVATNKYGVYPHTALESIADQLVSSGITHIAGLLPVRRPTRRPVVAGAVPQRSSGRTPHRALGERCPWWRRSRDLRGSCTHRSAPCARRHGGR